MNKRRRYKAKRRRMMRKQVEQALAAMRSWRLTPAELAELNE